MQETVKLQAQISKASRKKIDDFADRCGIDNINDATDAFIQAAKFEEETE